MALTENALGARARSAYELGRLRSSIRDTWFVAPIIAVGVLRHSNLWLISAAAVVLFAVTTVLSWRGQLWGRAVWPGYLAGAVPLLLPTLTSAQSVCWIGGSCWRLCALLCPVSGLLAGLAVGILATRQHEGRLGFLAATTLVAAATGAIGCALAGLWGIAGMLAGGLLGVVPDYLGAQLRSA